MAVLYRLSRAVCSVQSAQGFRYVALMPGRDVINAPSTLPTSYPPRGDGA